MDNNRYWLKKSISDIAIGDSNSAMKQIGKGDNDYEGGSSGLCVWRHIWTEDLLCDLT